MDHNSLAGERRGCCLRITNRGRSSLASLHSVSCGHAGRSTLAEYQPVHWLFLDAVQLPGYSYPQIRGLSNPVTQLNRLFFQAFSLGIGDVRSGIALHGSQVWVLLTPSQEPADRQGQVQC